MYDTRKKILVQGRLRVPRYLLFNLFLGNLDAINPQHTFLIIASTFFHPWMNEFPLRVGQIFAEVPHFHLAFVLSFTMRLSVSRILMKLLGYPTRPRSCAFPSYRTWHLWEAYRALSKECGFLSDTIPIDPHYCLALLAWSICCETLDCWNKLEGTKRFKSKIKLEVTLKCRVGVGGKRLRLGCDSLISVFHHMHHKLPACFCYPTLFIFSATIGLIQILLLACTAPVTAEDNLVH